MNNLETFFVDFFNHRLDSVRYGNFLTIVFQSYDPPSNWKV